MAEGDLSEDRDSNGATCSRAAGERQVQRREAAVPSTFGGNQRRPSRRFFAKGVFPRMKGIADTGFIVAAVRRDDRYHEWAVGIAESLTQPLLTCESVLSEAAFHLESSSYVLSLVEDELLQVAFDSSENIPQLRELARRYADRKPDLADLCLVRMSELYPHHPVITVDEADFRIYRRNKREAIPIICPPRAN